MAYFLKNFLELLILIALLLLVNFLTLYLDSNLTGSFNFFESGFENQLWNKLSPSLHFFKIGLIFILFDLEILFLFFIFFNSAWLWCIFLISFMISTLWVELNLSSASWTN